MKTLSWRAFALGWAIFFMLSFQYNNWMRKTAVDSKQHASVWIYTPYLSPQDHSVDIELRVYGGIYAGITEVIIRDQAGTKRFKGNGINWDEVLDLEKGSLGSDEIAFKHPLSVATPTTLSIEFEISYSLVSNLGGAFYKENHHVVLRTALPIYSPMEALLRRLFSALWGVSCLFLFGWLLFKLMRFVDRLDQYIKKDEEIGENFAYFFIALITIFLLSGYWIFVVPMMAALSISGWIIEITLMLIWIGGAVMIGYTLYRRYP